MSWKDGGSEHYKTGTVEPIDLYYALGIGNQFVLGNLIKYAARQVSKGVNQSDIKKMRHYLQILEEKNFPEVNDTTSWHELKDKLP